MSAIANIYAKKVKSGTKTIDEVPEAVRDEVKEILGITGEETKDE